MVPKLDGLDVKSFSPIALTALKVLHLTAIDFPHSRCLKELLAACPILEDFLAYSCHPVTYQDFNNIR